MSNLPVSSRLKMPSSRIGKPAAAKSEGIVQPRSSGLRPPSSIEQPQKTQSGNQTGLKQPLMKRSAAAEPEKVEKRGSPNVVASSNLATPRTTKQSGSQGKHNKLGLQRPQQTPLSKREGLSGNLKRQSSGSSGSLNKEPERPILSREKTQESLKDVETGILFKVGDRVLVAGSKAGVIEYLGETKFAKGYWAGVRLDEPSGKNDGCVAGVRYFDCEPLHGVFSKPNRLNKINIVPEKKNSVSDFKLDESNVLKIGDAVIVSGSKPGILRYLGPTEFAKGEWAGVELNEPLGKNDGAVAGTRYFSCEMKYGLFAPSSKVTKSKRQTLSKKHAISSPETSLASAAKSVFKRTASLTSEALDAAVSSPVTDKTSVSDANVSSSPVESLHMGLKRTPSNSQQVAALQSALEEREREIHKMLREREADKTDKTDKLKDETTKPGEGDDSSSREQVLKEKDAVIKSLKDDLERSKNEKSVIQTKLDEEKKKYEDLLFMLEEEKITDDELKNHVKEDQSKIKELSDQTKEKNRKIMELQKELRDARSSCLTHEAKVLELRDELLQSRVNIEHLRSNMATTANHAENNAQHLETLLANANQELDDRREEVNRKSREIAELQVKLSEQVNGQREIENESLREVQKKFMAAEAKNISLNAQILDLEDQLNRSKSEVSRLESSMAAAASAALERVQQLERLLAHANEQLAQSKEDVNKKDQMVRDMQDKLNIQLTRQKEIEKEVESLDQADKRLTLMKDAHRAELEALQSKVNSLTENISDLNAKHNDLVRNHKKEIKSFETSKGAEIQRLKHKILESEVERDKALQDCERFRSEKDKATEEVLRLQNNYQDGQLNKSAAEEKFLQLEKKYINLTEAKSQLATERNDAIQLCEEQDQQLDLLQKEKDDISLERDLLKKEKGNLSERIVSLETQIKNLRSESSMKQGALQEVKETEIQNLKDQLDKALNDNQRTNDIVSCLRDEKKFLENNIEGKVNEINKLKGDQVKLHSLSQELEGHVSSLKKRILEDAERAEDKITSLSSEIAVLKDDLEEGRNLVKLKNEDIRMYKEQIERMGSEGIAKSPMDGDILENASTLLIRLHEAESKLSAMQTEKETAEEQVEFLNSVIVDLQNKNQKAEQTIAMLEAGDDALLLHGLDSESDDEAATKPKFSMRKFCDICDVFDQHDTDECPQQESSGDTSGVKHFGDRNQERPYCGICEAFGHWSEDCDDEQTF